MVRKNPPEPNLEIQVKKPKPGLQAVRKEEQDEKKLSSKTRAMSKLVTTVHY